VYSLWYQRYMHTYGVTNVDFGLYPVVARKHASTNPAAFYYQQPLTLEQHQQSRWIVEPILRKLDCCQESDGGVAMIVTSMDRARDLPNPPVRVAAATQGHLRDGFEMFDYYIGDRAQFPEAAFLGRQLYEATGLTPDDIDVAMIYENFTPTVFMQLEAFGFCGPGEATDFIAGGNIEVGGKIPVNPNGGLLGEAYIHGMNNILEGVRQVRGTAANQVDNVEHVLVSAGRSGLVLSP
jgi:acetyl-CoA acetyltransferase